MLFLVLVDLMDLEFKTQIFDKVNIIMGFLSKNEKHYVLSVPKWHSQQ
jgi:hypothetical protein